MIENYKIHSALHSAVFEKMLPSFYKYVDIFCQEKYNKKGAKLHYFVAVFSNLSQIPEMRK